MANEKILNTRIKLKYDSFANWQTENPTLLEGEIAIAYLGETHTQVNSGANNHPVLFKVGAYKLDASGKKTTTLAKFNELPWASALAADVYGWAKAESVEFDSKDERLVFKTGNTEINSVDLSHFASDKELAALQAEVSTIDTNTTYSFTVDDNGDLVIKSKEKGGAEADVITVPILTNAELTAVLNNYVTNGSLATTLAGYVTNGTLDAYKAEVSGEFAKYTKTDDMNDKFDDYVLISELDAKVDSHGYLKVEDITGKADKTDLNNYYTKTEIGTIPDGKTVIGLIEANTANFDNYDTKGEVDTKISTALDDYYDKDEVDGLISDLATAMNFKGVVTSLPTTDVQHGDVVVLKETSGDKTSTKEYVWNCPEGATKGEWVLLGDESLLGQVATDLDLVEGTIVSVIGNYKGTLTALDQRVENNKAAIEVIYKNVDGTESGRLVKAEGDIADNKAAIEAIYKVDGSEKSGVLVSEIARVEDLIDDAEAALTNMTVSQDGTGGDYVNAISRDADGNIKYTKAVLPGLSAVVVEPANSVNPSAHEMTVLTAVEDSGTAGHAVKLKVTKDVAVTKAGAEAIATDKASAAVIDFAAGITVSGSGPAVVNVEKSNDNKITFTKGTIKIDELAQDAGTYVIFDCGTASTLI